MQQTFYPNLTTILSRMLAIASAQGAAIVDTKSGVCLREKFFPHLSEPEQALGMSAETLQAMAKLGHMMAATGNLEDIVATIGKHQYVARPLEGEFLDGLFLFLALERRLNPDLLALARYQLMHLAFSLSLIGSSSRADEAWDSPNPLTDSPFTRRHEYAADSAAATS